MNKHASRLTIPDIRASVRKYAAIAVILFKAQMAYRFDVAVTGVSAILRVMFAFVVWGAVYASRDVVGGFSYQQMLSYYVVSAFLTSIEMSQGVIGQVESRIRGGTFAKYMVIPTKPMLHFMAQTFGSTAYYAVFAVIACGASAILFRAWLPAAPGLEAVCCAVLMIMMGLAFMVCFRFWIGILTFKFEGIGFFKHIQADIVEFATGVFVPLALLPEGVVAALRFLPFHYVTYTPAMLLTGMTPARDGWIGLLTLAVWTAGFCIVSQYTYNRLRVRFDGVGI